MGGGDLGGGNIVRVVGELTSLGVSGFERLLRVFPLVGEGNPKP